MSGPSPAPDVGKAEKDPSDGLAVPLLGQLSCRDDPSNLRPCLAGEDCPECPEFIPGCCEQNTLGIAKRIIFGSDDEQKVDRTRTICCLRCTGNMQVLALTVLLFGSVTAAQTIGAVLGNSKSLLADSCAMWVDCATYSLNIFAEAFAGCKAHKYLQAIIPMISLSTLTYATICILLEALETLKQESLNGGDDDDVNPYVVLGFSLWCFFSDGTAIFAFFRNYVENPGARQVNMTSAFAHVAADFARSVTTFVESVLIMGFKYNGAVTDAWACVIVSAIILMGVALALWKWFYAVLALFSGTR